MVRKVFSRPIRFLPLVIAFATCHFGVFAVCYFFYRRSYYLAPTVFQSLCGVVTLILGYPLYIIKWIPREPTKVMFVPASMLNSLIYAAVLAAFIQLFRWFRTSRG